MSFLNRLLRGLLIGGIAGIIIALFTNFFFSRVIDRLENQTYDMRYIWELDPTFNPSQKKVDDGDDNGIHIVNIDGRSLQKLGVYWNWDRSFHAQLIESLASHFPASIVFDILFFDPEDKNHATRLDKLLKRSIEIDPSIPLSDPVRKAIISTINYDKQLEAAAIKAGNVTFGVRMSNKSDYPSFALSQVAERMTIDWHNNLHPSSTFSLDPAQKNQVLNPSNKKPIIDGIFPEIAHAAKDIAYVNIVPDEDGSVRHIPVFFAFGDFNSMYLPLSIRTVASLFATPTEEIRLVPKQYLDIGRPFKIFKDKQNSLSFSYPNVTAPQVKAIIDAHADIAALKPGQSLAITTFCKAGRDESNVSFLELHCGRFPDPLVKLLLAGMLQKAPTCKAGDSLVLAPDVILAHPSDAEWILRAPYGDQEYYLNTLDIKTLSRLTYQEAQNYAIGPEKLIFHSFTVSNKNNKLISSIPVLREATLKQLASTSWDIIAEIPQGSRMDFGNPVRIPLDENNQNIITYFGPKGKPFPYYSYYDIMLDRAQGDLEGKIYIVGSTEPDLFDIKPVPHEKIYPAVEIHASLINSFITNTFITRLPDWQNFAVLLIISSLIGFIGFMVKPLYGAILTVVAIVAYFLIAMSVFGTNHLWIEIARPVLSIILAFTAIMAYRYVTEEKDRKFLQSTFKRYLSPELIDMMYKNKQVPALGGDEGIRTAYFTDIQGFSTFSEKLGSPTRLVELLNEYLSAMTDILLSHYGTLDKYEGDAIIAIFGAPVELPDHAKRACQTALDMQSKLGDLRKKWISEGDKWPQIVHDMRMRIGVNTGPIVTGNMGSAVRMNYTMMGDAVNLAARLESAAKQYGVFTMISNMTYDLVNDEYATRQLDKITVVGKSEPVTIYELVAPKKEITEEQQKLLSRYNDGVALYYAQKWDEAILVLSECEEMEPNRSFTAHHISPSRILIDRCNEYKLAGPGENWDGVFKLTSK